MDERRPRKFGRRRRRQARAPSVRPRPGLRVHLRARSRFRAQYCRGRRTVNAPITLLRSCIGQLPVRLRIRREFLRIVVVVCFAFRSGDGSLRVRRSVCAVYSISRFALKVVRFLFAQDGLRRCDTPVNELTHRNMVYSPVTVHN